MSNTVSIGCKLPNGIIMEVEGSKPVRINGWNNNIIQGAEHGLTENVPAELWEAWKKVHAESRLVKGGFIFANSKAEGTKDRARGQKDNKSGHEQLPKIKETDKAGALGASDER